MANHRYIHTGNGGSHLGRHNYSSRAMDFARPKQQWGSLPNRPPYLLAPLTGNVETGNKLSGLQVGPTATLCPPSIQYTPIDSSSILYARGAAKVVDKSGGQLLKGEISVAFLRISLNTWLKLDCFIMSWINNDCREAMSIVQPVLC